MSVSTINDSKLDLPNPLEGQNNQTAFKAAVPYLAEYLTVAVADSAIALVAFNAHWLVVGAVLSVSALYAATAVGCTIIAIRASSNALEFNELIKPTIDKVFTTYLLSVFMGIVIVI